MCPLLCGSCGVKKAKGMTHCLPLNTSLPFLPAHLCPLLSPGKTTCLTAGLIDTLSFCPSSVPSPRAELLKPSCLLTHGHLGIASLVQMIAFHSPSLEMGC